jgi:hypothetical protein
MNSARQIIGLLNSTLKGIGIVTKNEVNQASAAFIMIGLLNSISENEKEEAKEFIAYCLEQYGVDLVKVIEENSTAIPPDVAEKILKARDSFVQKEYDEVWHWLYSIASPNYDKTEPWENLERMAGR